jgi:hypothetical protein
VLDESIIPVDRTKLQKAMRSLPEAGRTVSRGALRHPGLLPKE